MPSVDSSLIFGVITAAGTISTILIVIWNDGKTKGEIKQQITALQKDVIRQNGNGSHLSEKVELKVDRDDCIRVQAELSAQITGVHGRIDDLYSQRQESEDRILAAIRKRRTTFPRNASGR